MTTSRDSLDDLLGDAYNNTFTALTPLEWHEQTKQAIHQWALDIIGENEKEIGNHGNNEHITIPARNNLRFKQRAKLGGQSDL